MRIEDCKKILEYEMRKWNLKGWTGVFGESKFSAGTTWYAEKVIELSKLHILINDDVTFVTDTIRHEVAHALTFREEILEAKGNYDLWREAKRQRRNNGENVGHGVA